MDPNFERYVWQLGDRPIAGMCRPAVSVDRTPETPVDGIEDDVWNLWQAGFRSVVCLTDPRDGEAFLGAGFTFLALPIPDGYPPTLELVERFLEFCDSAPQQILVHCEGGMGRTGTMLATVLMKEGLASEQAIYEVRKHNPFAIETLPQEAFLMGLRLTPEAEG